MKSTSSNIDTPNQTTHPQQNAKVLSQPVDITVAILAQGTSWAVAVTQAFFDRGFDSGWTHQCKLHSGDSTRAHCRIRLKTVPCQERAVISSSHLIINGPTV